MTASCNCPRCQRDREKKEKTVAENILNRSLWMDCLYELCEENRIAGKGMVEFSEVDKLVIEKSKVITEYKIAK